MYAIKTSAATRRQPPWFGFGLAAERLSPIALRLRAQVRCGCGGLSIYRIRRRLAIRAARKPSAKAVCGMRCSGGLAACKTLGQAKKVRRFFVWPDYAAQANSPSSVSRSLHTAILHRAPGHPIERETVNFAPDLATHGSSLGWRSAHVAAPTEVAAAADAPPANVNNLCQMPSPTVWKSNFARSTPST